MAGNPMPCSNGPVTANDTRALAGQRALVTRGSSGIGAEIAERLALAGAAVAVNHLREAGEAARLVDRIRAAGGQATAFEADISREDQVQHLFQRTFEAYGSIDILVSSADAAPDRPFLERTLADEERTVRRELVGLFLCAREAAREFVRRGIQRELSRAAGKIVWLSPAHGVMPGHARSLASGGGAALMKNLARELAGHGVRVNAIAFGAVKTTLNRALWEAPGKEAELLERIPYGRIGDPRDIARAVLWLASDDSDYVTGATLCVDGGMALYAGCPGDY
jgi:glucose 1-dehydrogenase